MRSIPGRRATVGRGAAFEGVDHAGKIGVDVLARIAGDFERLVHDIRPVVPDRARRQVRRRYRRYRTGRPGYRAGPSFSSASISPCGIENGLWLKSTFFASSSYSNIGKSTIQQNSKRFWSISSSCSPIRVRAAPASLAACKLLAGGEDDAVVGAETEIGDQLAGRFLAVILGDRAAEFAILLGDIAEPRMAFAACPVVEIIEELAALSLPCLGVGIARTTPPPETILSNRPNPDPLKCSLTSEIRIGLRKSGLSEPYFSIASRYGMRAKGRCGDLAAPTLPIGEFLEQRRAAPARSH